MVNPKTWTYNDWANNINDAINNRLVKANTEWIQIRNMIPGGEDVDVKLRLMLFESLVTAEMLYRLHVVPITGTYLDKLQQFGSKCTRLISHCPYKRRKQTNNIR